MIKKEIPNNSSNIFRGITEANAAYGDSSARDRGRADAYYNRKPNPHKIVGHKYVRNLTSKERREYLIGYTEGEEGDKKDWG